MFFFNSFTLTEYVAIDPRICFCVCVCLSVRLYMSYLQSKRMERWTFPEITCYMFAQYLCLVFWIFKFINLMTLWWLFGMYLNPAISRSQFSKIKKIEKGMSSDVCYSKSAKSVDKFGKLWLTMFSKKNPKQPKKMKSGK